MSGLFGSAFGQSAQQQTSTTPASGGGLFGAPAQTQQQTTGGGLFGAPAQTTTQSTGGGLFGTPGQNTQQNTSGLLGAPTQTTTQQNTGTSLFGQPQQQKPTLSFGAPSPVTTQPASGPAATSSLFGTSTASPFGTLGSNTQGNRPFGGAAPAAGGLAGAGSSLFGAPLANNQQQPQQNTMNQSVSNQAHTSNSQPQPAGAYFDSLLAKSTRGGETKANIEDLPSLELGLGDLRSRLKKLQSKPNERPLDGKAHYLLAASGVDPGAAAKDLGMLDIQGGRAERSTHGGFAPSEMDVETYLSNLQTKTTLSMIADGLERSVRDFDNFLEDNVTMEWEAQRKRIYSHFGIKPREDAGAARESQGAFGRSRRSKAQGPAMSRTGRNSTMLGKSMHRSVIGAPSRIGTHQAEFSDVERTSTQAAGSVHTRTTDDRVLRERQSRLAEKVRNLNFARLSRRPYPIIHELSEVERKSTEAHALHMQEAYSALTFIVGEDPDAVTTLDGATAREREYASVYLDENSNSQGPQEMRKKILEGSTKFLEMQFVREVESLIAKHPHEARQGGNPTITSKIKAYIRLRAARKDLAPDNTHIIEVNKPNDGSGRPGEYIWATVFYLLRAGKVHEAAHYVNDNNNHFKSVDRAFPTYINNYASTEERRLTNRKLLDRCTNEYVNRARNGGSGSDPYRQACYKVIGRVELSNRNLEGLNTDINDWIWLQFNLAREGDRSIEMAGQSYGLIELQASIREIGQKHFPKTVSEDSNGSFGMFFYLQILAGMFEDAIAYLYPFSYVDAVHFGLALEFYGLLRPSDAMSESNDLRTFSTKNIPQINFGRMIGYYTRDFRAADVVSAVDYLTLICLNQDLGGEAGRRHSALCHEALRELVLETREFSQLIGDIRPDGRRIRGIIEERGPLIGLDAEDDFVNTVTLQAASFADDNGRTTDSVLLYHLAGEYDTVVSIVSRALSEAISLEIGEDPMRLMPVKPRSGQQPVPGSSLSLAAIDDPVELARTMMSMYERDAMFYRRIQDQNKVACRVLLEMSAIKGLVEGGQWATCLDVSFSSPIITLLRNYMLTQL